MPENAKIFIDLANNRAWTNADGEVATDTLLGADENSANSWGQTSFSADDLTVDGLVYSTNPPAVIGAALTKMLAGATIVYKMKQLTSDAGGNRPVVFDGLG